MERVFVVDGGGCRRGSGLGSVLVAFGDGFAGAHAYLEEGGLDLVRDGGGEEAGGGDGGWGGGGEG